MPICLLASSLPGQDGQSTAAGRPHIVAPVFRFESVASPAEIRHTFVVLNPSDTALRITRVRATCGCTTAGVAPETIPPGGEGKLDVLFKTGTRTGMQRKHVLVSTDNPDAPLLRCSLEGTLLPPVASRALDAPAPDRATKARAGATQPAQPAVRRPLSPLATKRTPAMPRPAPKLTIAAAPRALLFLSVPIGGTAARTVVLHEATGKPFEPVRATSGCKSISWRFEPLAQDHTSWRAIATCQGTAPVGRFRCQARVLLATGESVSLFLSGTTVAAR